MLKLLIDNHAGERKIVGWFATFRANEKHQHDNTYDCWADTTVNSHFVCVVSDQSAAQFTVGFFFLEMSSSCEISGELIILSRFFRFHSKFKISLSRGSSFVGKQTSLWRWWLIKKVNPHKPPQSRVEKSGFETAELLSRRNVCF